MIFRKSLWQRIKENWQIYVMLLPGVVFLLLVRYAPMYGLQVAFRDFNPFDGIWQSEFVGLKYFSFAFKSDIFWRTFANTLIISFLKWIIGMPMPIILAIMLNELRLKYLKRIFQTISYFPYFVSWVVVGGLAISFLGSDFGLVNKLLQSIGLQPVLFYQRADLWRPILVYTEIWKSAGWSSILYIAALSAVNTDLYEAIYIDGGGRFKKIVHVDIVALMPVFVILLILNSSSLVSGNFEQVFALAGDSIVSPSSLLAKTVETLEVYTYRVGLLQGNFSFSTAIGLFQNVLAAILIFTTNAIARRLNDDKRFVLF